jgi:hypothetical protein
MNTDEIRKYLDEKNPYFVETIDVCVNQKIPMITMSVTAFERDDPEVFLKAMQYAHLSGITVQLVPPALDYLVQVGRRKADG